jgi:hypothetical protein
MSKQTPRDIWNALVDEAGEDEIERAASVSVEEAERELAAAGFDVAAERARASAFLDAQERGDRRGDRREDVEASVVEASVVEASVADVSRAPVAEPEEVAVAAVEQVAPRRAAEREPRRRPRPVVVWLAAAATLTVGGGVLYAALHQPPAPGPESPHAPLPSTPAPVESVVPDLVAASHLRVRAAAACDAKQWSTCLQDLDEARTMDPAGDDAPTVKSLRERATRESLVQPKAPLPTKPP